MNGEHIISSLEEVYVLSRVTRKSSSGEYLGVGLPDGVRQVGWQKGDYVDLTLDSGASNGHQFQYLNGVKTEGEGQKIQHGTKNNPTLKLGIPIRWTDTDNDAPDFDIDPSSKVIVQLRPPDEVELIRASDFFKIHEGQKGTYPVSPGERETIDLATEHGYNGQRFRIHPFNTFSIETSMRQDTPALKFSGMKTQQRQRIWNSGKQTRTHLTTRSCIHSPPIHVRTRSRSEIAPPTPHSTISILFSQSRARTTSSFPHRRGRPSGLRPMAIRGLHTSATVVPLTINSTRRDR